MKIYIGADHNGFRLKKELVDYLSDAGHDVEDKGDTELDHDDDFPMYSARVATAVLGDRDSVGVLICGSGQGVCMAANRYKGIRASLVWDRAEAKSSRNDDDSNVLCLASRELDFSKARELVDVWLKTPFAGAARFKRRIDQLDRLN